MALGLAASLGGVFVSAALGTTQPTRVATAGVTLAVPVGWDALVSATPSCDPERLIVASPAPLHLSANGQLPLPGATDIIVVLLEDRYIQDRPIGDLRRPSRFTIPWTRLVHVKASCGLPNAPASMRYFKKDGRYLGFIVYPGRRVSTLAKTKALALMDSVRIIATLDH